MKYGCISSFLLSHLTDIIIWINVYLKLLLSGPQRRSPRRHSQHSFDYKDRVKKWENWDVLLPAWGEAWFWCFQHLPQWWQQPHTENRRASDRRWLHNVFTWKREAQTALYLVGKQHLQYGRFYKIFQVLHRHFALSSWPFCRRRLWGSE